MRLTDAELAEFQRFSESPEAKQDFERLLRHRHNPLAEEGSVDVDRLMLFLNGYNAFLGHAPKTPTPFVERHMRL